MNINDIVVSFKNHQLQYGLGGDPQLEELYKWMEYMKLQKNIMHY